MPFAAAAAATVIGAGVSAYGASQQAGAVKDAAKQSTQTQREAMAMQQAMYDQTRSDLGPYMTAGTNALSPSQALLGLQGPEAAQAAMANFQASPGHQYQVDQGMRAVPNSAAQGMLHSGATMKALQDHGHQMANIDFTTHYNRLMGLAGFGQNAAAGVGNNGVQTANGMAAGAAGIAQTQASAGGAQASIYGNAAQGIGNSINNGLNDYAYQQGLYGQQQNALYGGQGSGLNYGAGGSSNAQYGWASPSQ